MPVKDFAGTLYKARCMLADIMAQSSDLYRVLNAATGFKEDEYGNKSDRWADGLVSFRDALDSFGRDVRCYVRLPDGSPQAPEAPQATEVIPEAHEQSTTARDAVTVADAVGCLQRHCRTYVNDYRLGATSAQQRDLAMRLLDALPGAALLRG